MPEAAAAPKEKKVSILNLSKLGRRYDLQGGLKLLPNQVVEVPEGEAAFLLSKLANGRARFPDLVDADKMSPAAADAKKALVDDNAKLVKENAELRAKLAKAEEGDEEKKKGAKK